MYIKGQPDQMCGFRLIATVERDWALVVPTLYRIVDGVLPRQEADAEIRNAGGGQFVAVFSSGDTSGDYITFQLEAPDCIADEKTILPFDSADLPFSVNVADEPLGIEYPSVRDLLFQTASGFVLSQLNAHQVLIALADATATARGIVSVGAQTVAGPKTVKVNGLGVAGGDGIVAENATAAAAGAQQYGPRVRMRGQGWKTNATAASRSVDWIQEIRPVQGARQPTGLLAMGISVNAGTMLDVIQIAAGHPSAVTNIRNTQASLLGDGALGNFWCAVNPTVPGSGGFPLPPLWGQRWQVWDDGPAAPVSAFSAWSVSGSVGSPSLVQALFEVGTTELSALFTFTSDGTLECCRFVALCTPGFEGDGSGLTGLPSQAAGSDAEIQYNTGGDFDADAEFTRDAVNGRVRLGTPGVGATSGQSGFWIVNSTAATNVQDQVPGEFLMEGQYWDTGAAASKVVKIRQRLAMGTGTFGSNFYGLVIDDGVTATLLFQIGLNGVAFPTLTVSAGSFDGDFLYTPAAPADWVGSPTTVQEALDRIAAVVSVGGATPIP